MITVSQTAAERIKRMIADGTAAKPMLRVSVISGGCSGLSYKMDFVDGPVEGDESFSDKDIQIVVDKKSFFYLIGTELNYSEGLEGKGFEFVNPNASRTCACGESFSL